MTDEIKCMIQIGKNLRILGVSRGSNQLTDKNDRGAS